MIIILQDFRSEEGLYNLVKSRYPDIVVKGKDLFDSVVFGNPASIKVFYTFIAQLRDSILAVKETSPTHKFIRALGENGRLLRCYTQNIDGLEEREGMTTNLALGKGKRKRPSAENSDIPDTEEEKGCQVVQLHGDLNLLRCMQCQALCKYDKVKVETLRDGEAPDCPDCVGMDETRRQSGKRGTRIGSLRVSFFHRLKRVLVLNCYSRTLCFTAKNILLPRRLARLQQQTFAPTQTI